VAAAFFALHPLRVESVAWIAERKDVLSGTFWMLTLLAYAWYVQRPAIGRYSLVVLAFTLGLLSKPMLVTLPCVLLLLDWWPLGRFGTAAHGHRVSMPAFLIVEKLPLFGLTAGACVVTLVAQQLAVISLEKVSLHDRALTALGATARYLWQFLSPWRLAVFYPLRHGGPPASELAIAILVLIGITALAVAQTRRRPYLLVGWLWYLGTLVPVIGLVQVGGQSMADRYTYIPEIGIVLMLTWALADWAASVQLRPMVPAGLTLVVLVSWSIITRVQIGTWHDNESLWRHCVRVTTDNDTASYALGTLFLNQDRLEEAMPLLQEAVRLNPHWHEAQSNLAIVLARTGHAAEAVSHFSEAIALQPDSASLRFNYGQALMMHEQYDQALDELTLAAKLDETRIDDRDRAARYVAGVAWRLATNPMPRQRDPKRALELARRASTILNQQDFQALDAIGAAHAALGDFQEAQAAAKHAAQLAADSGNPTIAQQIEARLRLYESGRPFVEPVQPVARPRAVGPS
jgi:Flp pilus assembly protein TadD